MTSERTHLSIGEVLSLLQPDFPDITISKIRFLESQGLLDPERTPSGYRKFHDDDIEQLRWILTQQRDHFLPLKVIKERLAAGDLAAGAPEGVLPLGADRQAATVGATPGGSAMGTGTAASGGADLPPDPGTSAGSAPLPEKPGADAGDTIDVTDARAEDATGAEADTDTAREDESAPEAAEAPSANGTADDGHGRAEAVARLVEAPASETTDEDEDEDEGDSTPTGRRRHPTGHQPGEPTPEPTDAGTEAEPDAPARTIDLDELTELSGLSAREVGELERYGLIEGDTEGPSTTYDEECLVVARLAAGFGRYGIEPRHLRMYKVAAEREAGLFEQLISPLLKQRRPSARQQAVETLEDLAELADDLRAAMVRSALRDYLGGA